MFKGLALLHTTINVKQHDKPNPEINIRVQIKDDKSMKLENQRRVMLRISAESLNIR